MGLRDEETDCRKCCVSDFKNALCKKDFCEKYYREGNAEVFEKLLPHWIRCSERLPEESGRYIITAHDGTCKRTSFAIFQKTYKRWDLSGARAYWKVYAWMHLPEPYREEGGE